MERISKAINNIFFGLLLRIITMAGPFVVRVIIIRTIGKEYLGVSGVFSSILTALSLTELGFSSAISYKCYSLYANNDYDKIKNYLAFFCKIYRIIGCVILFAGLLLIPFLKYLTKGELPADLNLYLIYCVYLLNTTISYFIGAYKSVLLTISQRQDIESRIAIAGNSFMYVAQITVLLLFSNFYIYLFFLPISTFLINIFRIIITNRIFPDLYPDGMISREEHLKLYQSIIPLIGHRLQGVIVVSADNIVISSFINVAMVAVYNNYYSIIAALASFVVTIYAALQPGIGNSMAVENIEKNYVDFKRISFSMVWLVGWISICLVCLFEDFICISYGSNYNLGLTTTILLSLEFYIWHTLDVIMCYRDVIGRWNGDTIIPYISGVFNLLINILLVKIIGVNGVIISTILSFCLLSIPFSLKVLFKNVFKKSCKEFLYEYCLNTVEVLIIGVLSYFICANINFKNLLFSFFVKMFFCTIFPNMLFILLWHRHNEFQYILDTLIDKFKLRNTKHD